jgi:hypothetical protein
MIDFEPIGEVAHSSTAFVGVSNYDNFMATVDEILLWVSASNRRWSDVSMFQDLEGEPTVDN